MKKAMKAVILLAIPAMIENILQVFVGSVDTYFIGKLGTNALVGVGVTNTIMNIYIAFFFALGVGTTALVSRYYGAKQHTEMKKVLHHSVWMALIIGLFTGVINLLLGKQLLQLLNLTNGAIMETMPYYLAVSVPTVLLALMMVLSSGLRAVGDTKTPMWIGIIMNIMNVVLDYVLIFGIGSWEGMGFLGAGVATSISRGVAVVLLVCVMLHKNSPVAMKLKEFIGTKFDKTTLKSIGVISFPAAVEKLIMRGGQVLYSGIIIKISAETYAAHNIAGNIEAYSYLPAMGFSVAAATLVGQSLGKKDARAAKTYGWISYGLSTLFMIVIALIFAVKAPFFVGLFTQDPVVADFSVKALRIVALVQPFLASTLVITSALQGSGDTKFPMISTLIGIWSVRVFGIYVLGFILNLGIIGVWLSIALDLIIRGTLLMIRFHRSKWEKITLAG